MWKLCDHLRSLRIQTGCCFSNTRLRRKRDPKAGTGWRLRGKSWISLRPRDQRPPGPVTIETSHDSDELRINFCHVITSKSFWKIIWVHDEGAKPKKRAGSSNFAVELPVHRQESHKQDQHYKTAISRGVVLINP